MLVSTKQNELSTYRKGMAMHKFFRLLLGLGPNQMYHWNKHRVVGVSLPKLKMYFHKDEIKRLMERRHIEILGNSFYLTKYFPQPKRLISGRLKRAPNRKRMRSAR